MVEELKVRLVMLQDQYRIVKQDKHRIKLLSWIYMVEKQIHALTHKDQTMMEKIISSFKTGA